MQKLAIFTILAVIGMGLMSCGATSKEPQRMDIKNTAVLEGTVGYRERIAIPGDSVVTVSLQDISLADAPAKTLASKSFKTAGKQVPFNFELKYDEAKIEPKHMYRVHAMIKLGDKLMFTSSKVYPVITDSNKTRKVDVMMIRVRGRK